MKKLNAQKKLIVAAGFVLLTALLAFIWVSIKTMPVYGSWWNQEDIILEVEYFDYKGIRHSYEIDDSEQIEQIGETFEQVKKSKRVLRLPDARTGSISFQIMLKGSSQEVIYSLNGEYLAVADNSNIKYYTIYKLSPKTHEDIIKALQESE